MLLGLLLPVYKYSIVVIDYNNLEHTLFLLLFDDDDADDVAAACECFVSFLCGLS